MAMKALVLGIVSLFGISGSTCGKSTTEDATKDKPTPEVVLDDRDWTRLRNLAIVLFTLNYAFVIIQHRHPFL